MELSALIYSTHDDVPKDAGAIVDDGLGAFNVAAAPLHEVQPIATVARDAEGQVVGGAIGRTWGACCEVQQVWVKEECRRQGIASRLLRDLHARAEARGCRTFYLETFSFQAPSLYESLGYETKLELSGFSGEIRKYTMVRQVPTRGS